MFPIILTYIVVLWSECEANSTLDTTDTDSLLQCRTERRVLLPLDLFKTDTCARCYRYMPEFAFKNKFQ
ncbi:hypothetical protein JTE90_016543 [Oedothorax gibbosus]|uniref:Secreted protein n=1 Tax=Oedothorax gibbosus TaxID=931172 RepID=A0AAV6U688_9ARAC|nr:hypothetical protein JTE90_016543 [Oedothorax gibbosus]